MFGVEQGMLSPIVHQVLKAAVRAGLGIDGYVSALREKALSDKWDIANAAAAALRRLDPLQTVK